MKYLTRYDWDADKIEYMNVSNDFDMSDFWSDTPDDTHSFFRETNYAIVSADFIIDDASYIDYEKSIAFQSLTFERNDNLENEFNLDR